MMYKVRFNEMFKKPYFIDMCETDQDGNNIRRDKNSKPWLVNKERLDYLSSHKAIVLLEEVEPKKSKKTK